MQSAKQFAVVTRMAPVKMGGRIKVRTYGPFDRKTAMSTAQRLKRKASSTGIASLIEISCCTLQGDDKMDLDEELEG